MPNKTDSLAYALEHVELFSEVDGTQHPVTVFIRAPFETLDQSWVCAASINGLFHRKADLERASAEDAVRAARRFVREELAAFVAGGGRLLQANGQPVSDLAGVFSTATGTAGSTA